MHWRLLEEPPPRSELKREQERRKGETSGRFPIGQGRKKRLRRRAYRGAAFWNISAALRCAALRRFAG